MRACVHGIVGGGVDLRPPTVWFSCSASHAHGSKPTASAWSMSCCDGIASGGGGCESALETASVLGCGDGKASWAAFCGVIGLRSSSSDCGRRVAPRSACTGSPPFVPALESGAGSTVLLPLPRAARCGCGCCNGGWAIVSLGLCSAASCHGEVARPSCWRRMLPSRRAIELDGSFPVSLASCVRAVARCKPAS